MARLALHARVYGHINRNRMRVVGSKCVSCGNNYHVRDRLIKHLEDVQLCGNHVLETVPPLSEAALRVENERDAVVRRMRYAQGRDSSYAEFPPERPASAY